MCSCLYVGVSVWCMRIRVVLSARLRMGYILYIYRSYIYIYMQWPIHRSFIYTVWSTDHVAHEFSLHGVRCALSLFLYVAPMVSAMHIVKDSFQVIEASSI